MLHEPDLQDAANAAEKPNSETLAMFGERGSGMDYVEELIKINFPHLKSTEEFGWKHGFINPGYMRDTAVFVVVVRNALDWLRHLHSKPIQVAGWRKGLSLTDFIQHEWSGDVRGTVLGKPNRKLSLSRHAELMTERHPMTGARIRNAIELRNLKLRSQVKLEQMTSNIAFIRYEDAVEAPEEIMEQLQNRLGLPKCADFLRIEEEPTDETALEDFSEEDLKFIARELDMSVENALGYSYDLPSV